ncbi:ABC transporter permease [Pseudoalteromonas tunicata]|jgi:ABC-2 type transport system permease protein|uniref:Transport permease protein n=1 Tax=Pseudoalteromonas tunicata D2 TaxID=87626 RepID=A4CEZ8_9GAMM|nr:ABC transporter permease [Pseudoalteromonas tunicata]ATC96138.1 ABC-2 type transport system permease protein [Pseudoalteromonas tunicata]AXT31657.1 ABC transporter permease [Pseudoalteromonas tunicata]EAR26673.1 ABC transporter, permease protein [Pseudoalteromonas tunicata D2]MDP4982443.1 ABC transporter permease [Pseudoalteromonas tunicata]MDP5212815.1 ABC transporter permease [Pseudoalteromonas tunicata]
MNALRRILAIVIKEFYQLKRDKMTLRMVIMIPLIQLMLFGFAINTNVRHIPVALVDHSQNTLSRILVQTISATNVVAITQHYSDEQTAKIALQSGEVKAILVIPADLSQRLVRHAVVGLASPPATSGHTSRPLAQWLVDGSDTMIASAIKGLRQMPLAELLNKPVNKAVPTFEVALFFNPEQRTVVNIVPGLVGVILTMTMIMFTSAAIVRERERGNLEMLINTPIKPIELMLAKIVPFLLIGLLQMAIILGLGKLVFSVPINGSNAAILCFTLLFIAASLALGLLISTIAKTQLQSMQMTIFILLPSILLSGFMFPYEGMPKFAQYLAEALPATHYIRAIRALLLRDADIMTLTPDIVWLAGFSVFALIAASLRFKKQLD